MGPGSAALNPAVRGKARGSHFAPWVLQKYYRDWHQSKCEHADLLSDNRPQSLQLCL
jgi:hypothetical protein